MGGVRSWGSSAIISLVRTPLLVGVMSHAPALLTRALARATYHGRARHTTRRAREGACPSNPPHGVHERGAENLVRAPPLRVLSLSSQSASISIRKSMSVDNFILNKVNKRRLSTEVNKR